MASGNQLPVKHVQELALNGDEPPKRYIHRDINKIPINASLSSSIPIIDLHLLSSSSIKEREEEMKKLRSALTSWGLFQAIGHGISSSFLDEIREIENEFFNLPMEEKQKYSRFGKDGMEGSQGYGNDDIVSEDQVLNWSDRLSLLLQPENLRNLKLWPENPKSFREILHEYGKKANLVSEIILKAMAELVDLDENYFVNYLGEKSATSARFNYYPPCSKPDLVYGILPHTDASIITIVLQDKEVEGLHVLKDEQWIKVPVIPHALFINLGDQVEIMSNGIYKSPMHRVITNEEKARISLVLFYGAEFEQEIEPAEKLINEIRPRLFKKVKVRDYLEVFFPRYLQGKRAIDWAKV